MRSHHWPSDLMAVRSALCMLVGGPKALSSSGAVTTQSLLGTGKTVEVGTESARLLGLGRAAALGTSSCHRGRSGGGASGAGENAGERYGETRGVGGPGVAFGGE